MRLLPNKLKWVGLGLIVITLIAFSIVKIIYGKAPFPYMKEIGSSIILIGLLIIIVSQQKIEDERLTLMRCKCFIISFFYVITGVLLSPVFKTDNFKDNYAIAIQMCTIYLISFYSEYYKWPSLDFLFKKNKVGK